MPTAEDAESVALISIDDAAEQGIERIRRPMWAVPEDHIKIDIIGGKPGPWTRLYAPFNLQCNGIDPVAILFTQMDYTAKLYLPYTGALPDSDQYRAAQAAYLALEPST